MKWVKNTVRFLLVTAGIVVLTSMGIDASQYLSGSQSALGILVDRATEGSCPAGMTAVVRAGDDLCVDTYEASVGEGCPISNPAHQLQTAENISTPECMAVSEKERQPWVYVTQHQARELCARAGKRLPTNQEWYEAGLGTAAGECVIDEQKALDTGAQACVSGSKAYDMVGNVWEWVEAEVVDGTIEGMVLPPTGYVQNADRDGVAIETADSPNQLFGEDYFWSKEEGRLSVMRGGFYGSGDDAGLYAVHADVASNFAGVAIGFRCVK